jgi:hypothetical protein
MPDDTKEVIRLQVARVQRAYQGHGPVFRVLWVVAGATVVVAGLAMTIFPGPAIVVLPLGMAMLAAEFAWASRVLDVGIERGVDAKRRVQAVSAATKVFALIAVALFAGAILVFFVLRTP